MLRRTELTSFETHLGYWIRYVSNHVSHAFAIRLAAIGVTVAVLTAAGKLASAEPEFDPCVA